MVVLYKINIICHIKKKKKTFSFSGCGKALLAETIAYECQANLISVKGSKILSQENVCDIFNKARSASTPCVLFLDELDSIPKSSIIFEQINEEMHGHGKEKIDFIIVATNKPASIDSKILSRFHRFIYVPLPDEKSREAILKENIGTKVKANPAYAAKHTQGFAAADLTKICEEATYAAVVATRSKKASGSARNPEITHKIIDDAIKLVNKSVKHSEIRQYEKFKEEHVQRTTSNGIFIRVKRLGKKIIFN